MKRTTKKKRTKRFNRQKGGSKYSSENLMNKEFIINNLTDILNNRPCKYKFVVIKESNVSSFDIFNIFVDSNINNEQVNNGIACLSLSFFKDERKGVSIYIQMISKCASIDGYGKKMIDLLKEFAKTYGYYSIIIGADASGLEFNFSKVFYIDLAHLHILMTGESWYNKIGFYNEDNESEIENNKNIIKQTISEIDDTEKIINFIDDKLKYYLRLQLRYPRHNPSELSKCFSSVSSYGKFRELIEFILDITNKNHDDSIQSVCKGLYNFIRKMCNSNDTILINCNMNYETFEKINCFIQIIYLFLNLQYTSTDLKYIIKTSKNGGTKRYSKNYK